PEGGQVTPASQRVAAGEAGVVKLTPTSGWHIVSVSGCGGTLTGDSYITAPVTEACHIETKFEQESYLVSIELNDIQGGTVSPVEQMVLHGEQGFFDVAISDNWIVDRASGCNGSLVNGIYSTSAITESCQISILLKHLKHTVTAALSINGGGRISPTSVQVANDEKFSFTVTPDDGWLINEVTGCNGLLASNIYTTENIHSPCNITADFIPQTYLISTEIENPQVGTISPVEQFIDHEGSGTFELQPAAGWTVESVNGCGGTLIDLVYTTGKVYGPCSIKVKYGVDSKKYLISSENILNKQSIARRYYDGFDLDDVRVVKVTNDTFRIQNYTPRKLKRPMINVNGTILVLDTGVEAFSIVEATIPISLGIGNIASISFIDDTPFFKAKVKSFKNNESSSLFRGTTEAYAEKYLKQIRAQKYFDNRFEIVHGFLDYKNMNSTKKGNVNGFDVDVYNDACTYDGSDGILNVEVPFMDGSISQADKVEVFVTANDKSTNSVKLFSLLAHKPSSVYRILNSNSLGLATVGNGWLSVLHNQLVTGKYPKSTYEHEKLHNHGFGHDGGMTYGWSDQFVKLIRNNYYDFYSDSYNYLSSDKNYIARYRFVDYDQDNIAVLIWWGGRDLYDRDILDKHHLNKFIFNSNKIKFKEIGVFDNETFSPFSFDVNADQGKTVGAFNSGDFKPLTLAEINGNLQNYPALYAVFSKPSESVNFLVASGSDDKSRSGNLIVRYPSRGNLSELNSNSISSKFKRSSFGFFEDRHDYHVLLEAVSSTSLSGSNVSQYRLFSLDEAEAFCQKNNMTLATFPDLKAENLIEIQNKYLSNASMVGLDPISLEALSLSVARSNDDEYFIEYVKKGQLVLCR
ncbi:hypothetical protein, partial [Shewanella waksmanii]|uniref:hypothetical protein n=1 Tax=Shewanella waksmanii TaxID=213783 RepID=UPI0005672921